MNIITVFTPTYNRAEKLTPLYESLCRQSFTSFEWLIVDDGSTDSTEAVVKSYIEEGRVSIRYYKQENGGKMRAHNYGAKLCQTKYFVCVDSDDYLTDNAIEIMEQGLTEVDQDDTKIGLLLRKFLNDSDNKEFSISGKFITLHGLYDSKFRGETTLVFKIKVLREFPFPVVEGEKFITENIAYSLMDQKYEYLFISKAVTICEYNPDGYTLNLLKLYKDNPCGYVNYYCQLAELYGKEEDMQWAYMFTCFIKDKSTRSQYRIKNFNLKTKLYGYLRYLKTVYRSKTAK